MYVKSILTVLFSVLEHPEKSVHRRGPESGVGSRESGVENRESRDCLRVAELLMQFSHEIRICIFVSLRLTSSASSRLCRRMNINLVCIQQNFNLQEWCKAGCIVFPNCLPPNTPFALFNYFRLSCEHVLNSPSHNAHTTHNTQLISYYRINTIVFVPAAELLQKQFQFN